ncbi:MAG: DUF2934 domain-containing protein [Rhodospirillales bacterium]|nr:DUF2934 domain-containing protein [Rhodospirillales bacterium]
MSTMLHEMTEDVQTRVRELAYLMWESAGRQQGMAMQYWLLAESEVLSAMKQAAITMMPGSRSEAIKAAPDGDKVVASSEPTPSKTSPKVEAPRREESPVNATASLPASAPVEKPAVAPAKSTAAKAPARKPSTRTKAKA